MKIERAPKGGRASGWISPAFGLSLTMLLAVCLLFGTARNARAQNHVFEISPSVAAGFFTSPAIGITTPDGLHVESQVEDALTAGLTVGVRPIIDPLSIELEVLRSATEVSGSVPDLGDGASADLQMTYYYYGAAVRYQLPLFDSRVRPFMIAGMGEKSFDPGLTGTADPLTGNVGAGIRLVIDGWPDVRTEVRDYVSSFDPGRLLQGFEKETHTQHDVFWQVGIVLGLF